MKTGQERINTLSGRIRWALASLPGFDAWVRDDGSVALVCQVGERTIWL